jgi:osmotically-inducible protein OsmY
MDHRSTHAAAQLDQRAQFQFESTPSHADADIDGEARSGIAALTRQVNSRLAQWAAERAARRAADAHGVPSEIGAASSGSIRLSDADIARSAQGMLQSITLLPTGSINVVVDGGWITLSGSVQWNYQKQAAAAAIRHAIGATGVTDRVTVVDIGPLLATRSRFGPFFGRR